MRTLVSIVVLNIHTHTKNIKILNSSENQNCNQMRKENEPIRIICNGYDITSTHDIIVHARINNCGTKLNTEPSELILSPFDEKIECHCLSISNKRWIGTTGMFSYIVELIRKPLRKELKACKECGSVRLFQLPSPYEHITECQNCKSPN